MTSNFHDSAAIKFVRRDEILPPTLAPAILAAFADAFQSAHDEQNPGDSPALTKLDLFVV